jgi:hypothetical protein
LEKKMALLFALNAGFKFFFFFFFLKNGC